MAAETPPLPELIATWRKEYVRTKAEMQAASEPLEGWRHENSGACASWLEEDITTLTLPYSLVPNRVLSRLDEIDRYFHGDVTYEQIASPSRWKEYDVPGFKKDGTVQCDDSEWDDPDE